MELLFQVENKRAEETLLNLGIQLEDGQVLLTRKILDGRSISKINGETCTVSQMKAAASCLLDIHGQHEHQSLLYQDKQLEILDSYGKSEIDPLKEKVREAYGEYRNCLRELKSLDMDEEQRNRERAFLEFEIKEIESADLKNGEDEELESLYRKLDNGKKILDTMQAVHSLTGYDSVGSRRICQDLPIGNLPGSQNLIHSWKVLQELFRRSTDFLMILTEKFHPTWKR